MTGDRTAYSASAAIRGVGRQVNAVIPAYVWRRGGTVAGSGHTTNTVGAKVPAGTTVSRIRS